MTEQMTREAAVAITGKIREAIAELRALGVSEEQITFLLDGSGA